MATVHFGRLIGPVGFSRTVAIKRLHPQYAKDSEFVAMFVDEARLAARIQHPNVVPTLDIVATEAELFLVMDYVQGETLARLGRTVRERGLHIPPPIVAAIVVHALHGLHAAHEARDERGTALGIVHRDVSPQNLLVGVDGVTRVLDFGVAKATVRLQSTRDGQLKGKLAYMAPEQLCGRADRLTDIYAAGVVLWEALTAKRMYEAESEAQLSQKVLRGQSERPSQHVPGLPVALDEIVMRALDLDPKKRFTSAREMALALERGVEVAMSSEVGEWVAETAAERLTQHAERLAEIESSAHGQAPEKRKSLAPRRRPSDRSTQIHAAHRASADDAPARNAESHAPASPPVKREAVRRPRILVIDDSEVMLDRIRRALEAESYEVVTTTRAVGNARHIPTCHLAIIDYHMPGIDGGTVIQSLRAAMPAGDHRCLFYLYTSDAAIAKDCKALGFDGVITDKGSEPSLVKQVHAIFRIVQMRAMQKKPKR